jgi:hypothetical protein
MFERAMADEPLHTIDYPGGTLDDRLWIQAIIGDRWNERRAEHRGEDRDDVVLESLIAMGVYDHDDYDQRWSASTRAMRHTSAIANQLWRLLDNERTRVSVLILLG